ncbi:MAG TPA: hypothetical protein VF701_20405 [Thermoanaerobaculia bacterium]
MAILVAFLAVVPVSAATFEKIPTDRELLESTDLVVVATVLESKAREGAGRMIYTDFQLHVEDVLKGSTDETSLTVTQLGGFHNGRGVWVAGSVDYEPGSRVVAFLQRGSNGSYFTSHMGLGKFRFQRSIDGVAILVRDLEGVEAVSGEANALREASAFIEAIRSGFVAEDRRGTASNASIGDPVQDQIIAPAEAYVLRHLNSINQPPLRWKNGGAFSYVVHGSQGALNTSNAIQAAVGVWNNSAPSISLSTSGTGSKTAPTNDDVNDLIFGFTGTVEQVDGICHAALGCAVVYYNGPPFDHPFDGSTFWDIVSTDLVIFSQVSSPTTFEAILAHEMGHGLGFRHSNQPYSGTQPSTTNALMNSTVPTGSGATLRDWDLEAAAEVYGSGAVCTPVSNVTIGGAPANPVPYGGTVDLTANRSGKTPFTYQWYRGMTGDTSNPIAGATGQSFNSGNLTGPATYQYWVQVKNCGGTQVSNSNHVTVTVQECVGASIVNQPQSKQVQPGMSTFVSVTPGGSAPHTYQWFEGVAPDTSKPVGFNSDFYSTPVLNASTSYWVRITNECGTIDSQPAFITVASGCVAATVTQHPQNATVALGATTVLTVGAGGTGPFTYQWFEGEKDVLTTPINGATGSSYLVPATNTPGTRKYWVRVQNVCNFVTNSASSNAATVTAGAPCTAATISQQPQSVSIELGKSVTFSIISAGTAPITYQWYAGDKDDTSNPVAGATSSVYTTPAFATTGTRKYWVKVQNNCGSASSNTVTATVSCSTETPDLSVPAIAHYSSGYTVSWSGSLLSFPTHELQEATNESFTENLKTFIVNGALSHQIEAKNTLTADQRFWYRVRGISSCTSLPGPYSAANSTFVMTPLPADSDNFSLSLPVGTETPFTQPFFIEGFGSSATAGDSYGIASDAPWVVPTPSSGSLPAGGVTIQLLISPAPLEAGTTSATISVTRTQPDSLVGGRIASHGSSTLSLPFSISLVSPVTPVPRDTAPPPGTLIVPAIAHADGVGTRFQSDIRIVNSSDAPITYELGWTPSGTNGTQVGKKTTLTINGKDSKGLDDIVKNWYGAGVGGQPGTGTLEIRPLGNVDPLATFASSRTYAVTALGTLGQFIPAIPLSKFIGSIGANPSAKLSLQQISQSSAFRTNVGFVEGSGQPATLLFKLLGPNNTLLQQAQRSIEPYSHQQLGLTQLFPNAVVSNGRLEVEVLSSGGKTTAYASVVDNKTSDPLMVFPVQASELSAQRYVVPGVAEFITSASNFHSDMRIFNASDVPVTVALNYYPQTGDSTPRPQEVPMQIGPFEVKAIDDVLPTVWGLNATGGAVSIHAPSSMPLVVTARTFSRDAVGGTYGQFIPGVTAEDAVGNGERALHVLQLEHSQQYRTNLGLVEVTGQAVTLEIMAYQANSKVTPVTHVNLAPNEFRQFSGILPQMGLSTVYNGHITVRVVGGDGRVSAYGSVVDNRTADPTYVPAQ